MITINREEAIKWQEAFRKTYNGVPAAVNEAIDLAISALQEPEHEHGEMTKQIEHDVDVDRMTLLLAKCLELLSRKAALDLLLETVEYDEADCDGYCLMGDIEAVLFEARHATNAEKN